MSSETIQSHDMQAPSEEVRSFQRSNTAVIAPGPATVQRFSSDNSTPIHRARTADRRYKRTQGCASPSTKSLFCSISTAVVGGAKPPLNGGENALLWARLRSHPPPSISSLRDVKDPLRQAALVLDPAARLFAHALLKNRSRKTPAAV